MYNNSDNKTIIITTLHRRVFSSPFLAVVYECTAQVSHHTTSSSPNAAWDRPHLQHTFMYT